MDVYPECLVLFCGSGQKITSKKWREFLMVKITCHTQQQIMEKPEWISRLTVKTSRQWGGDFERSLTIAFSGCWENMSTRTAAITERYLFTGKRYRLSKKGWLHRWQTMFHNFHWFSSWWFQPIWEILVKLDHETPSRGENKIYLKPPTSFGVPKSPKSCDFLMILGGKRVPNLDLKILS